MTDLRSQLQDTLGAAYTLERELGGGGMSRVFVAEENAFGRKVVVKVLPPDVSAGVNVDRFKREIQVAAKLLHAHIVPVLTSGEMGGVPYYTMPFVEGESLRARLVRGGALSITEAVGVLRDIAKALAYAHDHGVVHRDIKPDNVLLSGGSASVADFGIAKAISAARDDNTAATLTQIGTSLGTPAYMAPEQAAADPATNHRADIYAFGCVAFELLAGRPPFVAKNPQRLLAAQMGEKPQPVLELRPDTPSELADLVMRCLAKDADARPQSAHELVRVLETVTSGGGHSALPPILVGGPGMFRRALMYYAAAFVVVLIVAQAAVIAIGLPGWVVPGATVVMLMGLPVILFTGYVQRVTRKAITMTPTYTPGGSPSMPQGTMATLAMKASPHVSWSRTARGGVFAIAVFVLLVGGFMLLRALGIGPAGSLFAAGKLSANERLLVADFGVQGTADSSIGSVVAEAIRTDLGQSRAVQVVATSAIRSALQRMQHSPDRRLDLALAREVAQREGIKAVVHGDVTPIGAGFIVTVRLHTATTGDELASFRETAAGPTELIPAVEKLSRSLRAKMGESLRAVHATPALSEVTTGSLDALRKYTEGTAIGDLDVGRAIALLQEAIALDSGFAMAWRKLSVLYSNAGYSAALRDSASVRAYRNRDRLTQTERDNVEGYYYNRVVNDRAKAAAVYERAIARGGEPGAALHNLALIYETREDYAPAESLYRLSAARSDAPAVSFQNLAVVLFHQGKPASADSVIAVAEKRFGGWIPQRLRATLAYGTGRVDSAAAILAKLRVNQDALGRRWGWIMTANLETVLGRLAASERSLAHLRQVDSARGALVVPLLDSVQLAFYDAWFRGQPQRAIRRLDAILAKQPLRTLPREQRPYFEFARAYAIAGRPDAARAMLARYEAEVRDTMRFRIDEPDRRRTEAEIALAEGHHDQAIDLFRRGERLADGPACECSPRLHANLARTHDLAGQADSAISYFEQYLAKPSIYGTMQFELDPLNRAAAHKRLGELYEARGTRDRALDQYQKFVEWWKDADPELQPKVAEVRRRIARLKDTERR